MRKTLLASGISVLLTGLAAKLISNFTNALTHTEVDEAMKAYAWEKPEK